MPCRGLYVFKHVGSDSNEAQRVRQAMLGCAPAYRLLDFSTHRRELPGAIVDIKKSIAGSPRSFADYQVTVDEDRLPMGVQLLKLC